MRIWGRVYAEDGTYTWQAVETTPEGNNDYVYITNLIQVLRLNRNESPFFANYGIPGQLSVVQQIFPDIYVYETQAQFTPFFASLLVAKIPDPVTPRYRINATTDQGVQMNLEIPA